MLCCVCEKSHELTRFCVLAILFYLSTAYEQIRALQTRVVTEWSVLTIFNGFNLEVIHGVKNFEERIQTQSSLAVGTPIHRVPPFAPFLTYHTSFLGFNFLTGGWNLFSKVSLSQMLRKRIDRRPSYLMGVYTSCIALEYIGDKF
jgi:hypothetical protein